MHWHIDIYTHTQICAHVRLLALSQNACTYTHTQISTHMHTYTLAHTPLMPGLCRHSCQAAETLMPLMPGCHSCQAVCEFAVCHSCQALCCHSCQAAETLMPLMPGCHLCQAVCECAVCRHSCQAVCRHSCQAVDTLTLTERLHKLGWDLLPVGGAHRQASPAGRCPESDGPVCIPHQVRVPMPYSTQDDCIFRTLLSVKMPTDKPHLLADALKVMAQFAFHIRCVCQCHIARRKIVYFVHCYQLRCPLTSLTCWQMPWKWWPSLRSISGACVSAS